MSSSASSPSPSSSSYHVSMTALLLLLCAGTFAVVKLHTESSQLGVQLDGTVDISHRRLQYSQEEQKKLQEQQQAQAQKSDRPTIYTYYEAPTVYDPNDDTADLYDNWRKAWYDMGWNPIILTQQNAEQLPQYNDLMALLTQPDLITPEAVVSYKRWMAMAQVGGGWMADVQLWPLNYFLRHGRILPNDGMLTVYQGTNPTLVSGTGEEYLRMVHQIGQTADKIIGHQKWLNENYPESYKKRVVWNDSVALQDMRKKISQDMFKTRMDVVEKNRLMKDGEMDCAVSKGKRAIFFRDLKANAQENRGTVGRKMLNNWRAACDVGQADEILPGKKKFS